MKTLNSIQTAIVINALHVAITSYKADADAMTKSGQPRIAEQFERQARDAKSLLDWLE